MFDIITFGSATRDIIVTPKKLTVLKYEKMPENGSQNVCFPAGSKIELEDIKFLNGGGGSNTAATFALQGFKTAFCGSIGTDPSAQDMLASLKKMGVDTKLVIQKRERPTNHSVVISGEGQDRTIFAYRGAAELIAYDEVPWKKLKAKWFYLAPLTGPFAELFEELVDFARKNEIKVAINPGIAQLSIPEDQLQMILQKVDIVFLNQEEASFVTKIPLEQQTEIFKKLDQMCPGITVMTKGGEGVVVSDGKTLYSAKPNPDRKVVDTTGAGDSFGSGFVAEYIRTNGDIEKSIQFGLGNSEANLLAIGAQTGLLKKGENFARVSVQKESFT